jgi:hypothetical protein
MTRPGTGLALVAWIERLGPYQALALLWGLPAWSSYETDRGCDCGGWALDHGRCHGRHRIWRRPVARRATVPDRQTQVADAAGGRQYLNSANRIPRESLRPSSQNLTGSPGPRRGLPIDQAACAIVLTSLSANLVRASSVFFSSASVWSRSLTASFRPSLTAHDFSVP